MSGVLAGGRGAVMTAKAGAHHSRMIDAGDRSPRHHRMAVLARVGGGDMGGVLARSIGAVMTAGAAA